MGTEYDAHIEAAVLALQIARQQITDEIRAYPTPIAGCDVEYNSLLSKRTQLTQALEALSRGHLRAQPTHIDQKEVVWKADESSYSRRLVRHAPRSALL